MGTWGSAGRREGIREREGRAVEPSVRSLIGSCVLRCFSRRAISSKSPVSRTLADYADARAVAEALVIDPRAPRHRPRRSYAEEDHPAALYAS